MPGIHLSRPIFTLVLLLVSGVAIAQSVALTPRISGLESPVAIGHAGDGSGRLFVAEQEGRILILRNNSLLAVPFLDIRDRVGCCGERGLLGIAFHPDYETTGWFFLNYTNNSFNTVISRFRVSDDSDVADLDSERVLLTISQPYANHNAGQLAFGPDGYLYIGTGDGGSAGDPLNNAQDPQSLLGKMLRIDVDGGSPYAIPTDNPFAGDDFTRDEIWALGLRNPFRFSFDRLNGDLFIADVGQSAIEEVNLHPAGTAAGQNFGWRLMEGSQCFTPSVNCNDGSLVLPILEYAHSGGRCSITGGFRYRGTLIDSLAGHYVYGDYCSGEIFAAMAADGGDWSQQVLLDTNLAISTFGEDENGELYVADLDGSLYQLVEPLSISPASGVYVTSQLVDLSLILRYSGSSVETIAASLDGGDVSDIFADCSIAGSLVAGGMSFRCPGIPLDLLNPGSHVFSAEVQLSDGSVLSDSVQWEVLGNSEP